MAERKRDEDVDTSSLDMNNETWKDRLDLQNISSSTQLLSLIAMSRQLTKSMGFDVTKRFVNREVMTRLSLRRNRRSKNGTQ